MAPAAFALSIPVIARDEEAALPSLFASLEPLKATGRVQFVVVDTGSRDRTRELAAAFGAEVHAFPWIDDFSAARNHALSLCRGAFLLWLDADDVLPEAASAALIASLGNWDPGMAYVFRVRSPESDGRETGLAQIRLVPNGLGLRFRNPVHESLGESVREAGLSVGHTGLEIVHEGYRDPSVVERKRRRNLALLEKAIRSPEAPATLLLAHGSMCLSLGRPARAERSLRRALLAGDPGSEPALSARLHLGRSLLLQNRVREALAVFEAGLPRGGENAGYLLEYGKALWIDRRPFEARARWRECLDSGASSQSIPTDLQAVLAGARKLLADTDGADAVRESIGGGADAVNGPAGASLAVAERRAA